MQPFETFEEIIMNIDYTSEYIEKDKIVILTEKIWHIEYFLKTRQEFSEKMELELNLCRHLLRELLDSNEDPV